MSWVTIIWSMAASACLTLAAMHLLVWCKKRTAVATAAFALSSFGTRSDQRGYTPGRYRDKLMFAVPAEYRWRITERLGVVAFGGVGGVAPEIGQFDTLLPSVGTGLRYVLAKKNNASLRFDAAWGRDKHTFYVGIGEAF